MITVSILWIGSEIILARTKHSRPTDARFDKSSLRILWVTISIAVNVGILLGFQHIGYFGNGSRIFPIAGLILIVCGLVVRWLAIFSLKHQFTVDVSITKDHRITRKESSLCTPSSIRGQSAFLPWAWTILRQLSQHTHDLCPDMFGFFSTGSILKRKPSLGLSVASTSTIVGRPSG